ncbi:MAG: chemotaxis protein CheW [Exilibacterium sp.]
MSEQLLNQPRKPHSAQVSQSPHNAAPVQPTMKQQWVSFTLGDEKYVLPVHAVREIMPYLKPTPVPGAPLEAEGVLNVRGEVITVLSGYKLLGLPPTTLGPDERRIIILEASDELLGVSVDGVEEIVKFHHSQIEPSEQSINREFIKGTVYHQENLFILVDFIKYSEKIAQHV